MTYDTVLETLSWKYSVVDCIDLTKYNNNSLLSALTPYKNKVFKDNERLVIIADASLPTKFNGYPPDIVTKMQEHIHYLNIAHFFILIVTNIDNMGEHLLYLQKTYYIQEDIPLPFIYI